MRYTETIRVNSSKSEPVAEFLAKNQLVKQRAEETGQTPIDWLADQFLPDAGRQEGFGDWITRQVCGILESELLKDSMNGTSHMARKVSGVEMSPEDRNWLVRTLGRHPVILGHWRSMLQDAIAA